MFWLNYFMCIIIFLFYMADLYAISVHFAYKFILSIPLSDLYLPLYLLIGVPIACIAGVIVTLTGLYIIDKINNLK